jgi:hypothetical protein
MSYDQKIKSARKVIDEHNSNADTPIDFEDFLKKLKDAGGSSEEALKAASWDDLQDCGIPKIMARRLTFLFRQDGDGTETKSTYISEKKVAGLSNKELVERYNPKDVKNPVGKRLKDLSDGKKFIVFDDNNKVIVDETVKLLEDILNGMPELETAFVNNRPLPTYSIGERPDFYVEENPIYPGRPLRSNETCDQTGRSWQGVLTDIRQLLNLAIETGELEISTVAEAHDILDKVLSKDSPLDSFRARYPVASKTYDAQSKMGKLPLLKIRMGEQSCSGNANNPFGSNTTY